MKTLHHPLRLNLGFMIRLPVGETRIMHYDYGEVVLDHDLPLKSLHGSSEITRTPQGLIIRTRLQTQLPSECGRCLTPLHVSVQAEFTELFAFSHANRAPEDPVLPDDGVVDLGALAREHLLLEVPINSLCQTDCRGLCPICGANLNEETCGHKPDAIDPRWSSLRSLLEDS